VAWPSVFGPACFANYFDFLRSKAHLRKIVLASESSRARRRFSAQLWVLAGSQRGDPNIVGKTFKMNDKLPHGDRVLPPVPQYPTENDVYMTTFSVPVSLGP